MKKLQINRGLLVSFLSLVTLLVPLHLAYPADVTLYDNMTGYTTSSYAFDQVYWYNLPGGIINQEVASSFSTGNFSGTLSSVVLLLHNAGGTPV